MIYLRSYPADNDAASDDDRQRWAIHEDTIQSNLESPIFDRLEEVAFGVYNIIPKSEEIIQANLQGQATSQQLFFAFFGLCWRWRKR
jgi:hypothetical protein